MSTDNLTTERIQFEIDFWTERLRSQIEQTQTTLLRALADMDRGRVPSDLTLGNFSSRAGDMNGMADRLDGLHSALRIAQGQED